jgi:hypothetical protein
MRLQDLSTKAVMALERCHRLEPKVAAAVVVVTTAAAVVVAKSHLGLLKMAEVAVDLAITMLRV